MARYLIVGSQYESMFHRLLIIFLVVSACLILSDIADAKNLTNVSKDEYIEYSDLPSDMQSFYKSRVEAIDKDNQDFNDTIKYKTESKFWIEPAASFCASGNFSQIEDLYIKSLCLDMEIDLTFRIYKLWLRTSVGFAMGYNDDDYRKGYEGIMIGWDFFKPSSRSSDYWVGLGDINTTSKNKDIVYSYTKPCYYKTINTHAEFIYPFLSYNYIKESAKSDEDLDLDGEHDSKYASSHRFGVGIYWEMMESLGKSSTIILHGGAERYHNRASLFEDNTKDGFSYYISLDMYFEYLFVNLQGSGLESSVKIGCVFKP